MGSSYLIPGLTGSKVHVPSTSPDFHKEGEIFLIYFSQLSRLESLTLGTLGSQVGEILPALSSDETLVSSILSVFPVVGKMALGESWNSQLGWAPL